MTGAPDALPDSPEGLLGRAVTGDRRSVGRLLTIVERGGELADEVTELTHDRSNDVYVVGMTGAPGSGKSTLTARLVSLLAGDGHRPAVLAVDPSSPLTGGAILGDRIRMSDGAGHDAFIRSMATRGHQGGLALAVPAAIRVFDACGFDPIIVETVGVGQVEVDIAATADTTVVVVTPGTGDAVQANKAGLLEVADVFAVNKADRPGAQDTRRDIELMLDLSHISGSEDVAGHRPAIVMTTATEGTGAPELWAEIVSHRVHLEACGELARRRAGRVRQEVRDRVDQLLATTVDRMLAEPPAEEEIAAATSGGISPAAAAARLVSQLLDLDARRRISP
jgi:LAO/AO transport system kinase